MKHNELVSIPMKIGKRFIINVTQSDIDKAYMVRNDPDDSTGATQSCPIAQAIKREHNCVPHVASKAVKMWNYVKGDTSYDLF